VIVPLAGFVGGAGVARCVAEPANPGSLPPSIWMGGTLLPWGKTQPIAQCIDTFDMTEYEKASGGGAPGDRSAHHDEL